MQHLKKIALKGGIVFASVILALGLGFAPNAVADNVGGGTWKYGTSWMNVWSEYYHSSRPHSATACVGDTCSRTSEWAGRLAGANRVGFTNKRAYWNVW